MNHHPLLEVAFLVASCGVLSACGGSAKNAATSGAERATAADEEKSARAPVKSGPDCSDGTCIVCGEAKCPKGFFCNESTQKPTCQWVAACSDRANCACVEQGLPGKCTCTERDGGAYAKCAD
jgi:hypothetical protein